MYDHTQGMLHGIVCARRDEEGGAAHAMHGHSSEVLCLDVTQHVAASGGADAQAIVWDLATGVVQGLKI